MTPSQAAVRHDTLQTRSNIATCGPLRGGLEGPGSSARGGARGRAGGAVCLSVCLSACLSACLSVSVCLPPPAGEGAASGQGLVHRGGAIRFIRHVVWCWPEPERLASQTPPVVKERVCWVNRGESLIFSSFLRSGTSVGDPAACLFVVLTEYLEPRATLVCHVGFSAAPLTSLGYTCREFWLQVSYTRIEFASYWQVSGWVLSLTVVKNYTQREPTFQQSVNFASISVYSMVLCLNADF